MAIVVAQDGAATQKMESTKCRRRECPRNGRSRTHLSVPLFLAGIFTFPLYSPLLARTLQLSASRLNLVASLGILGEYAASPIFGQVADRRGPGAVSAMAAVLFAVGFGGFGWRQQLGVQREERGEVTWEWEWIVLSAFWFLVGTAACASYFASLISLTKSSPARHSGLGTSPSLFPSSPPDMTDFSSLLSPSSSSFPFTLPSPSSPSSHSSAAIGLPCAVFGLSPLFLSSLAYFFTSPSIPAPTPSHPHRSEPGELDAGHYLLFLAVLLAVVNGLGAFFVRELPWEENLEKIVVDALEPEDVEASVSNDRLATLRDTDSGFSRPGTASPDERTALLRRTSMPVPSSPPTADEKSSRALSALVSTASFWLLGAILFLSTGPAEAYMSSVGAILGSLVSPSTLPSTLTTVNLLVLRKEHVSLLSISNTFARLAIGMLSDWLSAAPRDGGAVRGWKRNVRLWFIGGVSVLLALAYGWGGSGMSTTSGLWVITLGALFLPFLFSLLSSRAQAHSKFFVRTATGLTYGTVFTLMPALVRTRWGVEDFGFAVSSLSPFIPR
jgi:hypothetical protein